MRLLNVNSLEVEQLLDGEIRKYAILSHTWDVEEPNYADMVARRAKDMRGYGKIELAANEAKRNGLSYLWVDTICIDKTNSTELSEAINSMYKWYEASEICYVYLSDVHSSDDLVAIKDSRWFTRGWTLQELLAPFAVEFFTSSWASMGKRSDQALRQPILTGCNIESSERDLLSGFKRKDWSVAERMSWASRRKTTRGEDMAYCLLGIFDVHMPLLYGEGERAFTRLQEEIMRVSDDRSIFAWEDPEIVPGTLSGLLARNPAAFAIASRWRYKDRWSSENDQYAFRGDPHRMTSEGIYLQMPLYQSTERSRSNEYHGMLGGDRTTPGPAIVLERLANNEYARVDAHRFATTTDSRKQEPYLPDNQQDGVDYVAHSDWLGARIYGAYAYPQRIIVKQRPPILRKGLVTNLAMILLPENRASRDTDFGLELISVDPLGCWQRDQNTVEFPDENQIIRVEFKARHQYHEAVHFSVDLTNYGRCTVRSVCNLPSSTQISAESSPAFSLTERAQRIAQLIIKQNQPLNQLFIKQDQRFYRLRVKVYEVWRSTRDENLVGTYIMSALTIAVSSPLITAIDRNHRTLSNVLAKVLRTLGPAFGFLTWIWISYRFRIAPGFQIFRKFLQSTLLWPFFFALDRTMLLLERYLRFIHRELLSTSKVYSYFWTMMGYYIVPSSIVRYLSAASNMLLFWIRYLDTASSRLRDWIEAT